jgi:uncharacterized membrane protein
MSSEKLKAAAKDIKAQAGAMIVCEAVVLFSAVQYVGGTGNALLDAITGTNSWEAILGLVVSSLLICMGLALIFAKDKMSDKVLKGTAFVMVVIAFLEALICTFRRPFQTTGNGFFGSWFGLVCTLAVAVPLLPERLKNLMMPDNESQSADKPKGLGGNQIV